MATTPKLKLHAALINRVYLPHLTNTRRTQIYFGGSSSGKSVFLATRCVLDVLQGRNYLIARKVARTLRASCWNEIVKAIDRLKLGGLFDVSKAEMVITARNNGCQMLFAGLDDVEKIKSITPAKGVLTDIWLEEATELDYVDYKQLDKRLRGKSEHAKRVTVSFNPIYKTHWLYTEFFGIWDDAKTYAQTDHLSILKTTYRDNHFLEVDDIYALENEKDPYYRDVYTLGNWGVLGDVIFRNWRVEDLRERIPTFSNWLSGLDFGFAKDPCGFVRVHLDNKRKTIYVCQEFKELGLTNNLLADALRPIVRREYVTCDSAEPKSIQELQGLGIAAIPARKGPDSVVYGIQALQQYEIVVDIGCPALANELTLYQWQQDRDGNTIRQPTDKNNHLIDALRYAVEGEIMERRTGFVNVRV